MTVAALASVSAQEAATEEVANVEVSTEVANTPDRELNSWGDWDSGSSGKSGKGSGWAPSSGWSEPTWGEWSEPTWGDWDSGSSGKSGKGSDWSGSGGWGGWSKPTWGPGPSWGKSGKRSSILGS